MSSLRIHWHLQPLFDQQGRGHQHSLVLVTLMLDAKFKGSLKHRSFLEVILEHFLRLKTLAASEPTKQASAAPSDSIIDTLGRVR